MSYIKFLFPALIISFVFTAQAANYTQCPEIKSIRQSCSGTICNFTADNPGWEGFTRIKGLGKDTKIIGFISADWWNYSHNIHNGEMRCWYRGNQGGLILMTQGSWGGIEQPPTMNWIPSHDPTGKSVLICSSNPSGCSIVDDH